MQNMHNLHAFMLVRGFRKNHLEVSLVIGFNRFPKNYAELISLSLIKVEAYRCFHMTFNKYVRTHLFTKQLLSQVSFLIHSDLRSCHSQMSLIISVLKNFAIFTGKHLCWSLFLIKLQV